MTAKGSLRMTAKLDLPHNILVSPCAFKGTYGPFEVARAMARGVSSAFPRSRIHVLPVADGGDGTFEVLCSAGEARTLLARVFDPLMRPVSSPWAVSSDGTTAILAMSQASGLNLLKREEMNPLVTSSFGTGQLIREALGRGVRRVILGVGGSATVDGGVGALSALGFRFLDRAGRSLAPGGGSLVHLHRIEDFCAAPALREVDVVVACDVRNPVCGASGAARVYGPQKGAGRREVILLEKGLCRLSKVVKIFSGCSIDTVVGGGSAGGLAGSFWGLRLARLSSGFDLVAKAIDLERWIRWADLIVTGEGRLDEQTFYGKAVGRLIQRAHKARVPVMALAPRVDLPGFVSRRFPNFCAVPLNRKGQHLVALDSIEKATAQSLRLWSADQRQELVR